MYRQSRDRWIKDDGILNAHGSKRREEKEEKRCMHEIHGMTDDKIHASIAGDGVKHWRISKWSIATFMGE
jgi:uncharacterized protein YdaU (DUF1376 family)